MSLMKRDSSVKATKIKNPAPVKQNFRLPTSVKPIYILYFTDPISSPCWGAEPQLRKLKLEYGAYFDMGYRMGRSFAGRKDPLPSSYSPSVAFKAAQLQEDTKALAFLRRMEEMAFVEKKDLTKWKHLETAALKTGLDIAQFKTDFDGRGKEHFFEDLALAEHLGVRDLPAVFFTDEEGNRSEIQGQHPYETYVQKLLEVYPQAVKKTIDTSFETIFSHYPSLTTEEFALLTDRDTEAAAYVLNDLYTHKKIGKYPSKNGSLWISF